MRSKLGVVGVVFAICAIGTSIGMAAAGKADTTVTIKGGGEVFGYVKSAKTACMDGRKVTVYKQKGAQGGGDDIKGPSDTASQNGDRYMWSVGNPGLQGKIYARANATTKCKADNSKTITVG